jgi:repressor LexA
MTGISEKQEEMLAFIQNFVGQNHYPPTYEEIRTGLGISTKSLVNYHLEALEAAQLLTRAPNSPRSIRLKHLPSDGRWGAKNGGAESSPLSQAEVLELTYGVAATDHNLFALKIDQADDFAACGDIAIIQRQPHLQNGEIVAVRLPQRRAPSLKRYFRENGHVRLKSENTPLTDMVVSPTDVEIQGKVVAIIRQIN